MKEATLVFPHQLFKKNPALLKKRPVYILEDPHFFTRLTFHKQKLILHHASMHAYADMLKKKGYTVHYVPYKDLSSRYQFAKKLHTSNVKTIHIGLLYDHELETSWTNAFERYSIKINYYDTPYFMTPHQELCNYFNKKPSFRLHHFYQQQRKRFNILLTKSGKPQGGSWSFDKENRNPLNTNVSIPAVWHPKINAYVKNAKKWCDDHFEKNYGSGKDFQYPITHSDAEKWFNDFLKHRFAYFGTYQDAIDKDASILFHSVLSPLLNIGLLTPKYVVDAALKYAESHKVPLNSTEGFIRQIIGWREFVAGIYIQHGTEEVTKNFFKNKRKLPNSFWKGTTNINPVDTCIKRILQTAYAHHIERLMILGNFMLLCEIDPDDVYTWFMELFIDSYDWVMIPNVYGMSQFADGGWFATKPYISSSNYVRKMSNFKKDPWCDTWDGLYWNFIYKHKKFFSSQPRLSMMINVIKRINKTTLKKHLKNAKAFLKTL